ncbi:MAG TPA: hypothetical protein QF540_02025 [Gammaproteobacteria bacterium]|jgi:hypothetical protein|nr:hypothetical protein [Gammaproteobacteria bacterium]
MKEIKAEEYFLIGFELGKRNYWTIFFNFLIFIVVCFCAAITVVGILILPAIVVGFIKFLLKAARGEEVDVGDSLSAGFKNGMWWKALLFSIIYIVGIALGLMLLIAPGLYLITAWALGIYLLADKEMLPTEALGKSRELVHQLGFWKIFVVVIVLTITTELTSIFPILGLFIIFLMPFIMMTYVAIYENAISNPSTTTNEA